MRFSNAIDFVVSLPHSLPQLLGVCAAKGDTHAIMPPACVSYCHLQVPPPPAMDPAQEELLHQLMEVGYGNIRQ